MRDDTDSLPEWDCNVTTWSVVPPGDPADPDDHMYMGSALSYQLPCPTCGVRPFQQCVSLTKGKHTDTHAARLRR